MTRVAQVFAPPFVLVGIAQACARRDAALLRFTLAVIATIASSVALAKDGSTAEEVAAALANPLAPITTLAGNIRSEFGNGPGDDTNVQVRLQPSLFKPFSDKSALLVRTVVPLRFNNFPKSATGLGDVSVIPYYVPDVASTTFVGYGGALILPTATDDTLGSGKWAAGPAMIVAKTGKPITWGGLVQHVWSFAGASDRARVSVTTVQPFLTYLLPDAWAATVSSETTYNWSAASEDAWTVPATVGVSKVVRLGGEFINFGLAYVHYLERPRFTTKTELRLSVTYVLR